MSFKEKVIEVVKSVPRGSVITYAEVAKRAGNPRAYRAIGNIMAQNQDPKVPCHRVICSDGKPGGYNRGEAEKIRKLRHEKAIK